MNIWINRDFSACSKLSPHAKEAFILLATCYEQLVRTMFRSKSIASALEKLPRGSRLEIFIVTATDTRDWLRKHSKLSNTHFKSLSKKAQQQLGDRLDAEINSFLQEIRRFHPQFNIGIILGGEIGQTESQMSEYDQLLVRRQTQHLARADTRPK